MQRVLFHSTVFGPIHSRRLGTSLGINLSPNDGKICSFDCLYCEAGFNAQGVGTTGFPTVEGVLTQLEQKLQAMHQAGEQLDVITFSGNGEPTMHPRFNEIVEGVIALRDKYVPQASISVLANSTMLGREEVVAALRKVDNPILKMDSAIDETIRLVDRPNSHEFTAARLVEWLKKFGNQAIIQTMILRGEVDGRKIDNTTDAEVDAMIDALMQINPRQVMLYSIDRATPYERVEKVERWEMDLIAQRMRAAGIKDVTVS